MNWNPGKSPLAARDDLAATISAGGLPPGAACRIKPSINDTGAETPALPLSGGYNRRIPDQAARAHSRQILHPRAARVIVNSSSPRKQAILRRIPPTPGPPRP